MIDIIIKLVAAAGAYFIADKVTQKHTGKHIHEHVFAWWNNMRDELASWIHQHPEYKINQISLRIVEGLDNMAISAYKAANQIKLRLGAVDQRQNDHFVTVREVSAEELLRQFPEFRNGDIIKQIYSQ
jgi:hypothetical protein